MQYIKFQSTQFMWLVFTFQLIVALSCWYWISLSADNFMGAVSSIDYVSEDNEGALANIEMDEPVDVIDSEKSQITLFGDYKLAGIKFDEKVGLLSQHIDKAELAFQFFFARIPHEVKKNQGYFEVQRIENNGYLQLSDRELQNLQLSVQEMALIDVLKERQAYLEEVLQKGEFFEIDPITQRYNADIAMKAILRGNTAIAMRSLAICEYFFEGRRLPTSAVIYAASLDGDPLAQNAIQQEVYQDEKKLIWQKNIKIGRRFYESILKQRRKLGL